MKKRFWKIEYSITFFVIFAVTLMLVPTRFMTSKEATYISNWNDVYRKIEYMFTAMAAQENSKIIEDFNNAKTNDDREQLMMDLTKPYLRITELDKLTKNYSQHYMNGEKVQKNDEFAFNKYYVTYSGKVVGIKDIKTQKVYNPAFIMSFDVNGTKAPNTWGKDIFGINIFVDGHISPLGSGEKIDIIKSDCSPTGTGVYCSHYYRIGGNFNE